MTRRDPHHDHAHTHSHAHAHAHEHAHDHEHAHEHAHTHEHAHEHTHTHDHAHAHAHAPEPRELLARGCGRDATLFFDCFSGIAGNMTIGALLDLGVPLAVVEEAVAQLPIAGYRFELGTRTQSGIAATHFDVAIDADQPPRTYGAIDAMLQSAPLQARVAAQARAIFRRLGEAEAAAHRMPLMDVSFHEVGAVDAIVDIVGSAAALDFIGATVVATPLPMGRGFTRAQHGVLPLQPPRR